MTRQLGVLAVVAALCLTLLYAGCNADDETPTPRSLGFGEYGVMYMGPTSMEEHALISDAIARVKFVSAEQTIEIRRFVFPDGQHIDNYVGAVVVTFDVLEYLKGSGGNRIKAVLFDGDWTRHDRADIVAADEDFLAFRDKQWDDREAIVFLSSGQHIPSTLNDSDRYHMGYLRANGEQGFTVDSKWAKAWLPDAAAPGSEQASGNSAPSGDAQRFLTSVSYISGGADGAGSQSSVQMESMTLGEIKAFIKKLEDEVAAGDGTAAYRECVEDKYAWAARTAYRKAEAIKSGDSWNQQFDGQIDSGAAAGARVYTGGEYLFLRGDYSEPTWSDDAVVISGQDAALFEHQWPLIGVTVRPLPSGIYRMYWAEQHGNNALCNAMPEDHKTRDEVIVTVTPPAGTLHEAFFDPVALASGVGASGSAGVLEPDSFSVGGTDTTISGLRWDKGDVVLTLSPYTALSGHRVDFIALDGSISLTLDTDSATGNSSAGTLAWSVESRPWQAGDLLMLRISEDDDGGTVNPTATPAPTPTATPAPTPTPTPVPTATPMPTPTPTPSVPEVSIAGGSGVTEGGSATFTLTADPTPSAALSVAVTVSQVGDFGVDVGSRTVSIPTSGSATLSVDTKDDSLDEADGSVTVTVNSGSGYTVSSSKGAASVAVSDDDDPGPTISVKDTRAREDDGTLDFTVELSDPTDQVVTVQFTTSGGTATWHVDYEDYHEKVTIAAGQTQVVVSVKLLDDEEKEGDETVFVWLNFPTGGATLEDRQGRGVIVDDD